MLNDDNTKQYDIAFIKKVAETCPCKPYLKALKNFQKL